MASGRVITGFSAPWVAKYAATGTTVTYTSAQILARGVNVKIEPEDASSDNIFYADNVSAEVVQGIFTGGTLTLTVDGLLDAAEKLVYGLPAAESVTVGSSSVNVTSYGDNMSIPYVGVGFVIRYQNDGVVSYVPMVVPKCRFKQHSVEAATQESDIDWQTQELEATILRDDSANHNWKKIGEAQTTEAEAVNVVKALLGA